MDSYGILRSELREIKEEMREMKETTRTGVRDGMKGKRIVFIGATILLLVIFCILISIVARQSRQVTDANREIDILGLRLERYKALMLSKVTNISVKTRGLEDKIITIKERYNQLYSNEFVWPIGNFSEQRKKAQNMKGRYISSEPFFSHKNGYKMGLTAFLNGYQETEGTHLSLYVQMVRGPFDDILKWPFIHNVTIALVNQHSGANHFYTILNFAISPSEMNPTDEGNHGYGMPKFIRLRDLLGNGALIRNDRIFIKCTPHIT